MFEKYMAQKMIINTININKPMRLFDRVFKEDGRAPVGLFMDIYNTFDNKKYGV